MGSKPVSPRVAQRTQHSYAGIASNHAESAQADFSIFQAEEFVPTATARLKAHHLV